MHAKQIKILEVVRRSNGFPISFQTMANEAGLSSKSVAFRHIHKLIEAGYIRKYGNRYVCDEWIYEMNGSGEIVSVRIRDL